MSELTSDRRFVANPTPRPNALLRLAPNANVVFHVHCRYPNAWWRFWQRVFFGFQWERI